MDYRQFYDNKYSRSAQGYSSVFPRQMRFLLRWMGFPKTQQRVLDLGGGTGEYSMMLQQMGHDVTLYELSQVAIDHARKLGVTKTVCADFFGEPSTEQFDIVLVKGFSPLNTDDQEKFDKLLNAISTMLAPGGVVLYWSTTDMTGHWSNSGWFNWQVTNLNELFDEVLIFPALRYQAVLPVWFSRVVHNILLRLSILRRPFTVVAYRRAGGKVEA
jgi:SAM-dependent methyltransferase